MDHDLHRRRRGVVQKFFSRGQIVKLEPEIHRLAQGLCDKMLSKVGNNIPFDVTMAYSCFTSDVISEYCFGEPFGFVAQQDFEPNFRPAVYAFLGVTLPCRYIPGLVHVMDFVAPLMGRFMSEAVTLMAHTLDVTLPDQVNKARADHEVGVIRPRETVFDALLSSSLPQEEKSTARLVGEASTFLGAGTETVSWALAVITFYLQDKPDILKRATEELQTIVNNPRDIPSWTILEQLPYLRGVIMEGLRLSYGVTQRMTLVIRGEELVYHNKMDKGAKDYVIPRNTPIGTTSWMVHHDEKIFSESHDFRPERWINDKSSDRALERYLMSFSRGSRQCIGMQLAYCELYVCLASLLLRVFPHIRLFETTLRDVAYDHDMFVPMTVQDSKGVRVLMV